MNTLVSLRSSFLLGREDSVAGILHELRGPSALCSLRRLRVAAQLLLDLVRRALKRDVRVGCPLVRLENHIADHRSDDVADEIGVGTRAEGNVRRDCTRRNISLPTASIRFTA